MANEKDEAQKVVENIKLVTKDGGTLDDVAVFIELILSRQIEDVLRKYGLPYRVVGGIKFYERKEIKDIISYLRVIVNEKDSLAISESLMFLREGLGRRL